MSGSIEQTWSPTPLEGGPLSLPLEGLSLLARLAIVGYDSGPVAAVVRTPESAEISGEWERTCLEHKFEDGAHLFSGEIHVQNAELFHRLGVALKNAAPVAGTSFELASREPQTSQARQHYVGTIAGETLVISSSYPALSSSVLAKALELFRQGEEGTALRLASAEVAAVVYQAAHESIEFVKGQFSLDGDLIIRAADDAAGEPMWLSKLAGYAVLRTPEFAKAWDLHEALRTQEANLLQATTSQRAMLGHYAAVRAAAGGQQRDVVHEGRWGSYLTAEISELNHVADQDKADMDALMAHIGFEPVGGLTCPEWYGAVSCGYTCPGRDVFGLVRADLHGRFNLDFRSLLDDGGQVVTSTRSDDAEEHPEIGKLPWLRYASHPLATPEQLLDHHRQALASAGPAKPVTGLEGVASAIDALMARLMKMSP